MRTIRGQQEREVEVPSGAENRNELGGSHCQNATFLGSQGQARALTHSCTQGAWCRNAPHSLKGCFQDMAAPFKLDCLLRGEGGICPESVVSVQLLMQLFLQKQTHPAKFVICR